MQAAEQMARAFAIEQAQDGKPLLKTRKRDGEIWMRAAKLALDNGINPVRYVQVICESRRRACVQVWASHFAGPKLLQAYRDEEKKWPQRSEQLRLAWEVQTKSLEIYMRRFLDLFPGDLRSAREAFLLDTQAPYSVVHRYALALAWGLPGIEQHYRNAAAWSWYLDREVYRQLLSTDARARLDRAWQHMINKDGAL